MRQRVDRPSPAEHNGEAGAYRGLTLIVEVPGTDNSSRKLGHVCATLLPSASVGLLPECTLSQDTGLHTQTVPGRQSHRALMSVRGRSHVSHCA